MRCAPREFGPIGYFVEHQTGTLHRDCPIFKLASFRGRKSGFFEGIVTLGVRVSAANRQNHSHEPVWLWVLYSPEFST
jgi:hypothetical protein